MDFIRKAADKAFDKLQRSKDRSNQMNGSGYTQSGAGGLGNGAIRETNPGYPGFYPANGGGYNLPSGYSNPQAGNPGFYPTTGGGYDQSSGYSGNGDFSSIDHTARQISGLGGGANGYAGQGYGQTPSGYGSNFDQSSAQQTPGFGGAYAGYGDQGYGQNASYVGSGSTDDEYGQNTSYFGGGGTDPGYGQNTSWFGGGGTDPGYGDSTGISSYGQSMGAPMLPSSDMGLGGVGYDDSASTLSIIMQGVAYTCSSMQSAGSDAAALAG